MCGKLLPIFKEVRDLAAEINNQKLVPTDLSTKLALELHVPTEDIKFETADELKEALKEVYEALKSAFERARPDEVLEISPKVQLLKDSADLRRLKKLWTDSQRSPDSLQEELL